MNRKKFGHQAETFVATELEKQGFTIQARNYQKLYGEIDIIAQQKELLVFIEVKCRQAEQTLMHELITPAKQRKIIKVARAYISCNQIIESICRFDVALVHIDVTQSFKMTYISNAFTA